MSGTNGEKDYYSTAASRFLNLLFYGGEQEQTPAPEPEDYYSTAASRLMNILFYGGEQEQTPAPEPEVTPLFWGSLLESSSLFLPTWTSAFLKGCLAVTVALHVLNQKHLLPKPLARIVSKTLFWPTLPITVVKRIGSWSTVVDDAVVIGGAPLGLVNFPERLYNEYNVRGVINLCEEFPGPDKHYKRLGIRHLRLPTVDHFEPTVADLERGVAFIKEHLDNGNKVYVHCKAGHGRSAAVVFAWLIYKDPKADLQELNREFCLIRNVRKKLWTQRNILEFQSRLQKGEIELTDWSAADDVSDKDL